MEKFLELPLGDKQQVSQPQLCCDTPAASYPPRSRVRPSHRPLLQICMRLGCSVESVVLIVENLSRLH